MDENPQTEHAMSERQIAERLGISRARVWQLHRRAMKKLRAGALGDRVLRQLAIDVLGERAIEEAA